LSVDPAESRPTHADAGDPLEMMRERGLDIADYGMLKAMTARVQASPRPQRAKGVLRSSPGDGPELLWEMVLQIGPST
jgi:hypothetical protein